MAYEEYPKQLYRKGWDDLEDTVVVTSPEAEEAARADGFKMLSEPQGEESAEPRKPGRPRKVAE